MPRLLKAASYQKILKSSDNLLRSSISKCFSNNLCWKHFPMMQIDIFVKSKKIRSEWECGRLTTAVASKLSSWLSSSAEANFLIIQFHKQIFQAQVWLTQIHKIMAYSTNTKSTFSKINIHRLHFCWIKLPPKEMHKMTVSNIIFFHHTKPSYLFLLTSNLM